MRLQYRSSQLIRRQHSEKEFGNVFPNLSAQALSTDAHHVFRLRIDGHSVVPPLRMRPNNVQKAKTYKSMQEKLANMRNDAKACKQLAKSFNNTHMMQNNREGRASAKAGKHAKQCKNIQAKCKHIQKL